MAEILDTYLSLPTGDEGMNFDEEEDEVEDVQPMEEPVQEGFDEAPPPPEQGNMQFGQTPGGSQTVTTTNTLTPPSVPGGTPAPSNDTLFDDAPDDVKKIPT